MKRYVLWGALGFLVIAVLAAQSVGKTFYVAVKSAPVKASADFFANTVGELPQGAAVTVLQETPKWARVRTTTQPAMTGWMALTGLTSRRPAASGNSASAAELALAGKGFNFSADLEQAYRNEERLSYDLIDAMEAQTVGDRELRQFLIDGRLARGD